MLHWQCLLDEPKIKVDRALRLRRQWPPLRGIVGLCVWRMCSQVVDDGGMLPALEISSIEKVSKLGTALGQGDTRKRAQLRMVKYCV